ncbi:MAG: GNAT family N-acetyltransferase [Acidimicrobiales bacterium]
MLAAVALLIATVTDFADKLNAMGNAYDTRKLRARQSVIEPDHSAVAGPTRRGEYHERPRRAARPRRRPILAGVNSPRPGRRPAEWTQIDRDCETLRIGMQTVLDDNTLSMGGRQAPNVRPCMSASSADILRWGREQARTGRWRGEGDVALLTPVPSAPLPSAAFLHHCLEILASRGFTRVVTGALSPLEQAGFLAAGFDVAERLHLLSLDLAGRLPAVPRGAALARPRGGDRGAVLAVDAAAFSAFWQLDAGGLDDSLAATPSTRWRVARPARRRVVGAVDGYCICGRSGGRGFVQRLAVDPARQGRGTGRRLLLDGLHWMRRHGARSAVVNTQLGNDAALALYRSAGFRDEPVGLSVLAAGL